MGRPKYTRPYQMMLCSICKPIITTKQIKKPLLIKKHIGSGYVRILIMRHLSSNPEDTIYYENRPKEVVTI